MAILLLATVRLGIHWSVQHCNMAAAALQFQGAMVLRVSLCISYAYFCVLRGSIRYCCHFLLCIVYAFLNSIVKWTIGLYKTMEFTIFVQVGALVVFWSLQKLHENRERYSCVYRLIEQNGTK